MLMPKYTNVKCEDCGFEDIVVWGLYGSEQPCLNCDAASIYLRKVA
jgi:ribosomal protein S27E